MAFMRNELIHARYRMSLQEQRLLLWLIAQVKREDTDLTVYRIGVKQLADFIAANDEGFFIHPPDPNGTTALA
jgi:hypothetical protein